MANKVIYLEPDEDITSVINRIRKSDEEGVVLSIPRGGTIGQSAVNLKLLIRNAATLGKSIGLVTNDRITQNLASRLEIKTFSKVSEAEKAHLGAVKMVKPSAEANGTKEDQVIVGGLNVHTYQKYSDESSEAEENLSPPSDDITDDSDGSGEPIDAPRRDLSDEPEELDREDGEPEEPHFASSSAEASRGVDAGEPPPQKISGKHLKPEGSRRTFFIISAIAVVAVLVLSYLFIPFAEASLVLETKDSAKTLEAVADRDKIEIDTANLFIPAELVSVEKEGVKQASSTGTKDAGAKASGTVTLYNKLGATVTVNTTMKVIRDDKEFILSKSVFIPAATGSFTTDSEGHLIPVTTPGQVEVGVTAAANGVPYNLAPGKFSISGKSTNDVWAENKAAFSGGVTKEIKYVTADDLQKGSDVLKEELSKASETDLRAQADEAGIKIADESLNSEIISTENSKAVDQEAEGFEVKMKIKAYVIGFKESDLKQLVFDSIKSGLESNSMLVNESKAVVNYKISSADVNDGLIKLSVEFQGKIGKRLDESKIKNDIKNTSITTARNHLQNLDGVVSSSLKISPSFWKLVPLIPSRIKIKFDYKEESDVSGN